MAPPLWSRVEGLLFGGAIGAAMSKAMEAVLEPVRQHAWQKNPVKVLDLGTLAALIVKGLSTPDALVDEATRNGYDLNRLDALVGLGQSYPGLADLDRLSNRTLISPELLQKALSRHGFGAEWHGPLTDLFSDLLSVADTAAAVQQGHVPNDGILPEISAAVPPAQGAVEAVAPDQQPPSHVPLTQIDLDPIKEAAGQGYDLARLKVRANLAGLPPGPEALLAMWNRNLIDEESVDAGIREGHMKTKWAGAFKRMRWAVLSGQEYAEARLRDWISQEEMYAGGALTGHTTDQMDLFYKNRGRTATPRQIWLGIARKVPAPDYPDEPANGRLTSEHDHELAIRRSNIRPEYAPLLYDIRFNYPPLFQLNRLVQAGAIDAETAATWAEYNLEAPEVVAALKAYWSTPKASASKTPTAAQVAVNYEAGQLDRAGLITKLKALGYSQAGAEEYVTILDHKPIVTANGRVLTRLHELYIKGELTKEQLTTELAATKLAQSTQDGLIAAWEHEARIVAAAGTHGP